MAKLCAIAASSGYAAASIVCAHLRHVVATTVGAVTLEVAAQAAGARARRWALKAAAQMP